MKDKLNKALQKYPDDVQDSFCILPFVHTFLNTEGDVFPCCISWEGERKNLIGYVKDQSLEELFNSPEMKQLRLDFINGKKRPDVCVRCYTSEENGFRAGRHGNNYDLEHLIDEAISATREDGYIEPKLKSWDIRFSNLCNLKCRSCGDIYSTTWSKEDSENYDWAEYREIKAYEGEDPLKDQYDNVEKIYFAGGEPLIMPEHYNALSQIIKTGRAKKVRLVYNTNMTKLNYNNQYLVDYWKEFKKVTLGLSIDNFGDRANYIRHGSVKWKKIENNIRELAEYCKQPNSNLDYFFSPTVSVLNAYTLTDMHKYFFENGLMAGIDDLLFNILYHPAELSFDILPNEIKKEIREKITTHIEWIKKHGNDGRAIDQFESFYKCLEKNIEDTEKDVRQFIQRTKDLDRRRNECFSDTFPEYKNWWDEINNNFIEVKNL